MMKIAVIGGGNMGAAIAAAAVTQEVTTPDKVVVSHLKKGLVPPEGILTTRDNIAAATDAQYIVLAVKPWLVADVLREIAPHIDPVRQLLVSVAAGISFAELADGLGHPAPALVRVIPNTALAIGRSVTFLSAQRLTPTQHADIRRLFDAMGVTFEIGEEQLDAGMALASCGIAYALRYIDAAARGGVELGMDYAEAQQIVMQTLDGALGLLRANRSTPQAEIDKVTTPGGITLRGLEAMERNGFSEAVLEGLRNSR